MVSELVYAGVEHPLVSISTAGSTAVFEYNSDGKLSKVVRGDGSSVEYDYDSMGNRTALRIEDADEVIVRQQKWAYDELGRLLRAVGAAGQVSQYRYDLNDNPVGITNARQFSSSGTFDELDRQITRKDALNGITQTRYDAFDRLTEVQDPRGVTTRYQYDGLGNLAKRISPDSGTTTFEYDAAGNIVKRTDARGVVVEYRYDALDRLIERRYPATPSLNERRAYDSQDNGNYGISRLTSIEDSSGSLVYRYDARGNLIEQVRSLSLNGHTLSERVAYRYDAADNLMGIDYPGTVKVGYLRNAASQVERVTLALDGGTSSDLASQISYMPFGPLKQLTWGNGPCRHWIERRSISNGKICRSAFGIVRRVI